MDDNNLADIMGFFLANRVSVFAEGVTNFSSRLKVTDCFSAVAFSCISFYCTSAVS